MKINLLILLLLLNSLFLFARNNNSKNLYLSIAASYMELKDEINFGQVYIGPDATLEFGYLVKDEDKIIDYSFSFGGGGKIYNDSWGFRWEISPVDFVYGFNLLNKEKISLYLGPSLNIDYGIQNYPDMHSGFLNWMTSYSLGIDSQVFFKIRNTSFKVQIRNSLLSLTGRPEKERDQYYFSLNIGDIISNTHSNMSLSPFYEYLETGVNLEMMLGQRHSLAFDFQYNAYFIEPIYKELNFSIQYTFFFKGANQ